MAMMEAMACGVPVIAPNHGVFPELIGITSGGALFDKDKPEEFADILRDWMDHPEIADAYGKSAREGIAKHYRIDDMIRQTRELYGEIAGQVRNASQDEP
jgi:glycosyltransferase involved in cell wall biosynthesis